LKTRSPFVLAFGALVLALTTPAILAVAWKLGAISNTFTSAAAPVIALAILFAFAFHVRFALGAFQARKPPATAVAAIAVLVGVSGFVGAMLVLMGLVALR